MFVSVSVFSRLLIGKKYECYIVIEGDELDKGNISAAAGKQGWAELFQTCTNIKLYQITLNYKIFWNTIFCSPVKGRFSLSPLFPPKKNMKRDPPENIFNSVHIVLLNIFPNLGLVRLSRLVCYCCQNGMSFGRIRIENSNLELKSLLTLPHN